MQTIQFKLTLLKQDLKATVIKLKWLGTRLHETRSELEPV